MKDDNNDLSVDLIFWYSLIIFNCIICFTSLCIIICFKHKKTHADILTIEKKVIDILAFLYFGIFLLLGVSKTNDEVTFYDYSFISIYLICHFTYNIAILYEEHSIRIDPTYLLKSYTKKGYNYFYEIVLVCFILLYFLSRLVDIFNRDINVKYLFCDSIAVAVIIVFLSSVNVMILKQQKNILFELRDKKGYIKKRFLIDCINFAFKIIFVILYIFMIIISKINRETDDQLQRLYNMLRVYTSYFLFFIFIENFVFLIKFYFTDFYFYSLSKTCIKYLFKCFGENAYKRPLIYSEESFAMSINKNSSAIYFNDKLNLSIDETILNNFDFSLNCITASLFKAFSEVKDDIIESKDVENTRNTSEETNSKLNAKLLEKSSSVTYFNFGKNEFASDEKLSKLFKESDNLEIVLSSYYRKSFAKLIREKKINIPNLKNSLVSHILENGMVVSLLDKNCKESQFASQKSLIIRTLDKQYGLEFVDESFYKNTAFFKKYIKHLRSEKNSFVPSILGIFKIKVNKFKEISFILVKNNFVEEFPKDLFNYWQILRLNNDKEIELLSTSKERQSLIITEEPLLSNGKKLSIFEYHTLKEILSKDLNFLRSMKIVNFSLIFLYYEIGTNIPNTNFSLDDDKAGVVIAMTNSPNITTSNVQQNKDARDVKDGKDGKDKEKFNISAVMTTMNRISNVQYRTSNQVGNDFSYENSIRLDLSNLQDGKGFEAVNNNLKSMIFFNFENVFQNFSYFENVSMYDEFKQFLIGFFEEIYA